MRATVEAAGFRTQHRVVSRRGLVFGIGFRLGGWVDGLDLITPTARRVNHAATGTATPAAVETGVTAPIAARNHTDRVTHDVRRAAVVPPRRIMPPTGLRRLGRQRHDRGG